MIVDKCGSGAKFSNVFFGIRFNEKNIQMNEILAGFSCSYQFVTIVLLYNSVNINDIKPTIFIYSKDGIMFHWANIKKSEDLLMKLILWKITLYFNYILIGKCIE